tara:strand:+ start:280 stop:846 length:567 start_codon:yes stop_codon:yes gene_type:complete
MPSLMLNIFFMINILFFFVINVTEAKEFESDLILAKNNISFGKLAEAELILDRVLKKDPSYAPAYVLFSKIWLLKADIIKASESASFAVRIDEDFRPWWNELNYIRSKIQIGTSNVKKQNYASAEKVFLDLIQRYPTYPELHYYLGMAQYKQRDYNEALDHFNKALDLFPGYSKAQKALVNVKKRIKK